MACRSRSTVLIAVEQDLREDGGSRGRRGRGVRAFLLRSRCSCHCVRSPCTCGRASWPLSFCSPPAPSTNRCPTIQQGGYSHAVSTRSPIFILRPCRVESSFSPVP